MTYLLDTDIVADWLQGKQATVELVSAIAADGIAISLITYGEIYDGIGGSRDPRKSEIAFRAFLRGVAVLPLTRRTLRRFARMRRELRQRGRIIGDMDILIPATALERDLVLVTGNIKHFEQVPDLRLHR